MPFGCCWAGVKILQNPFLSEVRAPFEVLVLYGFYEGRYLRAAQGLVCKMDAICLVAQCMCKKGNLCSCIVGMGIGTNRGCRQDHDCVVMGGHAQRF